MKEFDNAVFNNLNKGFKKRKHISFAHSESFEEEVQRNLLKFDTLKKKDPKAKITRTAYGYSVNFSKQNLALDLIQLLAEDNKDVDLQFSQDLLEFEPDEELIHKSKVPLWVIKPVSGNKVMIQRAF